jgi:peptidase M28-like protein
MIRTLTRAALMGGLFALVSAPSMAQEVVVATAGEAGTEQAPALVRALQEVQPERISADLHFIASDAMAGRDTPSKELEVAAHFLRSRLQKLEFEPGAGESYFYEYPLVSTALDPEGCSAGWSSEAGEHSLALATDYYFGTRRVFESCEYVGEIVSVGEGTSDDFEGVDLTGRWVMMLDREGGRVSRQRRMLRDTGAVGLLVVQSADYSGEPLEERFGGERFADLIKGSVRFPRVEGESRSRKSTPIVYLERKQTAQLLAACAGSTGEPEWFPKAGSLTGVTFRESRVLKGSDGEVIVKNVCGLWGGSDPELSKEVIIISAHYDHVGRQGGEIHNGADDNGSGTSGVLAVADALHAYGPMKRSIMLMWVSGEEKGLWGSKAWSNNPMLPDGYRAVANINIDMIGRNDPNELFITPTSEHKQFNPISEAAMRLSPLEGFPKLDSADDYYHRSDQAEFARLGIPVAFLFAGVHEDYHRPTDTPDKIDYEKLSRVVRLVVRLLDEMQTMKLGL